MRRSVLIADDDRPLLSLLGTIVSRSGDFDIVACHDGEEAIEALALRHYDVVLLDLMMPRRSGFDVLDYLQQNRPEQLRFVVVLSAAPDQLAHRLDGSVVHGVLSKPFDVRELVALINQILEVADEASR